jgi:hypothetical protein
MNEHWLKLCTPPAEALSKITGGRLSGYTDINPQWRYKAMTDVYGECGIGWGYEIKRQWTYPGTDGQVFAFAEVQVWTAISTAMQSLNKSTTVIPGVGGSMLIERQWDKAKNESYLFHNDDAFKMAVTDALSVALKFLGVGSDVYEGKLDHGKPQATKYTPPVKDWKAPTPGVPMPYMGRAGDVPPPGEVVVTKVVSITEKKGTKQDGSPWTRSDITFANGEKASTFHTGLSAFARTCQANKADVEVMTEPGKLGAKLIELRVVPSAAIKAEMAGDDLPPVTDEEPLPWEVK